MAEHTDRVGTVANDTFLQWLRENGAIFPKINWPSNETVSGIRGAVCTSDILTNEHMIQIPAHLMLSPPNAFSDAEIGSHLRDNSDMLSGDVLLTIYLMHELRKQEKSFYFPFLNILPTPGNVTEWSANQLLFLQDKAFSVRIRHRNRFIQMLFDRSAVALTAKYPEAFPSSEFTYDRFKFSWLCIQARAFGRRLPWTALVPFADCLNHSNVQTKYDFNIDGNKMFRLFPSGSNHYPRGTEVFNSYGRRPNDNLLMDYGFALPNNEWDEIEFLLSLDDDHEKNYRRKFQFLQAMSLKSFQRIFVSKFTYPLHILAFSRALCATEEELTMVDEWLFRRSTMSSLVEDGTAVDSVAAARNATTFTLLSKKQSNVLCAIISGPSEVRALLCVQRLCVAQLDTWPTSIEYDEHLLALLTALQRAEQPIILDADTRYTDGVLRIALQHDDDAASSDGSTNVTLLTELRTTLLEGDNIDVEAEPVVVLDETDISRLISALQYRLTRKHIVRDFAVKNEHMLSLFRSLHFDVNIEGGGSLIVSPDENEHLIAQFATILRMSPEDIAKQPTGDSVEIYRLECEQYISNISDSSKWLCNL